MITYRNVGLYGRLGNALFEIASTIGLAHRLNEPVIFPATWIHRPFFSIPDELFGNVPEDAMDASTLELVSYIDPRSRPYLQDVNLFWPWIDEIREYFAPSKQAVDRLAGDDLVLPDHRRLAIHVRRGDKVQGADPGVPNNTDYHLCMPLSYYQKALDRCTHLTHRVVISDDIPWCKEHIPAEFYSPGIWHPKEQDPLCFTQKPMDWIDLFLLSMCDYFILSGSTFGIWGAILADVPPDHVLRPSHVYGPLNAFVDESTLFPEGWGVVNAA